ncbi:MAG: hypothetical protein U1E36_01690 [Rickettsiales bacterium]
MRWLPTYAVIAFVLLMLSDAAHAQGQALPTFPPTPPENATPAAASTEPVPAAEGGTTLPTPVEAIEGLLKSPAEEEAVEAGAPSGFVASYGKWKNSLFFSSADIESIRRILMLYESGALDKEAAEPTDPGISEIIQDLQIQGGAKVEEKQPVYPRFKLRSIIYRSPAEWVVLLNDIRISSYNNSVDKEITVIDVNKSSASFKWKPADEILRAALAKDASARKSGSASEALKNRAAVGARVSYDTKAHAVFFTLSVNQDFDSKTFDVQEGSTAQKAAPTATGGTEAALPAVIPTTQPFPSMQPITSPLPGGISLPAGAVPTIPTPAPQTTQGAPVATDPADTPVTSPATGNAPAPAPAVPTTAAPAVSAVPAP